MELYRLFVKKIKILDGYAKEVGGKPQAYTAEEASRTKRKMERMKKTLRSSERASSTAKPKPQPQSSTTTATSMQYTSSSSVLTTGYGAAQRLTRLPFSRYSGM